MKKNIIANFAGRFWSILSNFLFIPLYIKYLGFESYSVISFTLMITGVMAILDGGLTATLSREFSRKDQTESEKKRVFRTLESFYFITVFLCILIIFLLSGFIGNQWLNVKTISPERISFFLKVMSFEIGFQLLFRFYMGGLLGLEKQVEANYLQIGWGIFRNGLVVLAILFSPKLETFFIWQMLSTIIFTFLIKIFLEKIMYKKWQFSISPIIERRIFKRIWQFAGGMMLISVVAALNTQLDKLTISKVLSIENLGYYTLAVSIAQGLIVLVNPISIAVLPRFTAYYSSNQGNRASLLYNQASTFITIIVFAVMMIIILYAKRIIWIWTGELYLGSATERILQILAVAYAMIALQLLPYTVAIANGYTKLNNILGISSLLVTIPGYLFATRYYGSTGAASVFCAVQIISTVIYFYYIFSKFLDGESKLRFMLVKILKPFLVIFSVFYIFSFLPVYFEGHRLFSFIWICIINFIALILSTLVLLPMKDIKHYLNFRNVRP